MSSLSTPFKLFILFVALMPLVAGFGSVVQSPYQWKMWFGIVGVSVFFSLTSYIIYKNKEKFIYSNLLPPILLFVLWCIASLLWVVNLQSALSVIVQFLSYLLVFICGLLVFSDQKKILIFFKSIVVTLFIIVLIGLLQYYYTDIPIVKDLYFQTGSMGSAFGNRNMAVQFTVITLPLAFYLFFIEKKITNIALYVLVIFTSFLFLINSTARQGYVAISIETFLFFLFLIADYYKNRTLSVLKNISHIKVKLLAIFIIGFGLVLVSNVPTNNSINKIERFTSISEAENNSRVSVWINTLEMIKDNPVIGVGAGQWNEYYRLYYNRSVLDEHSGEKVRFNDAHNDYLETLANYGLIGFLILLWLIFLVIRKIFHLLINPLNSDRPLILALTLGLIGFSIVALVSFPINWYVPGFFVVLYLSIISSLSSMEDKIKFIASKYNLVIALFSFLFLIFFLYYVFNTYKSEYFYFSSVKSFNSGNVEQAVIDAKNSINSKKTAKAYAKAGLYLLSPDINKPKEAISYFIEGRKRYLFNIPNLLNLAEAYRVTNNPKEEQAVLKNILNKDSKNVIASVRLVTNLVNLNMYDEANPFYIQLKYNFDYFKDAIAYGPYHSEVASVALLVKDYKYFSYVYDDLLSKTPKAEDYIVYGIIEYQRVGNKSKAKELFNKALKLDKSIEIPEEIAKDLEL